MDVSIVVLLFLLVPIPNRPQLWLPTSLGRAVASNSAPLRKALLGVSLSPGVGRCIQQPKQSLPHCCPNYKIRTRLPTPLSVLPFAWLFSSPQVILKTKISLRNPGCSGTCQVDQTGLKLIRDPPTSALTHQPSQLSKIQLTSSSLFHFPRRSMQKAQPLHVFTLQTFHSAHGMDWHLTVSSISLMAANAGHLCTCSPISHLPEALIVFKLLHAILFFK